MFEFQQSKGCVVTDQGTAIIHTPASIDCARGPHLSVLLLPLFTSSEHRVSKDLGVGACICQLALFGTQGNFPATQIWRLLLVSRSKVSGSPCPERKFLVKNAVLPEPRW